MLQSAYLQKLNPSKNFPLFGIFHIFTPHACARGKAIGMYICRRRRRRPHENRLFGRSRPLSDL